MRKLILGLSIACMGLAVAPAFGQVEMSKQQILMYTADWEG